MSAFDDAKELIRHAEGDLAKIHQAYETSLHAKAVSGSLLVQIKNFFENQKKKRELRQREENQAETFRETEEMKIAESLKKEADRQIGKASCRERV